MADNNTYTLPVLTAANINGIVTQGQNSDGTYNITYTNLTGEQIQQIGNAFEIAMQTNLKNVALSGKYNDLNVKPGIPTGYTQASNFSRVAFSGKASDLDNTNNDAQVFLTEETDPIFSASPAAGITIEHINNLNNYNYANLPGAPVVPEDIDAGSHAYETIDEGLESETRVLKSLKPIAFTGDYADLTNSLTLSDVCQIFSFIPALNTNLANLTPNTAIDTTEQFRNDDSKTIGDILNTIIYTYNTFMQCAIKIIARNGLIILNTIQQEENYVVMSFSAKYQEVNYASIRNTTNTNILQNIQFNKIEYIFLYDMMNNKLFILLGE